MKALKFILKWGFFFSIWIAVFSTIAVFYYFQGLPTLDDLENETGKQLVKINYSNDNLIANRGEIYSSGSNYYELPQSLIDAVVAIEDRRFFSHIGIDVFGIARAFSYGGSKQRALYDPNVAPTLHQTKEAYQKDNGHTINHFYEKLLLLKERMETPTAQNMAQVRHAYMETFLAQFMSEWNP